MSSDPHILDVLYDAQHTNTVVMAEHEKQMEYLVMQRTKLQSQIDGLQEQMDFVQERLDAIAQEISDKLESVEV